jgi:hypothetical protein
LSMLIDENRHVAAIVFVHETRMYVSARG